MFKGNILVVDTDAYYSGFYQKLLSKEGYKVFSASSMDEGTALLGERSYEVVIADMVLQDHSGLDLLKEIKSSGSARDVIMITSMQSIKKAVEALKIGASDYLTKPVDAEELLMLINTLIDRQNISEEHSRLVSENVLFYEQFRVQKRGLELLSLLDTDRLLDHFLDVTAEETKALWAAVWLLSPVDGRFNFAAHRGVHSKEWSDRDATFQTDTLREQFFRGRALLVDREGGQSLEGTSKDIHSFRLPLIVSGQVIGFVAVGPRRDEKNHDDYHINIARVLAENGGAALKNARHFSLEAARDLRDSDIETYSPAYFHHAGVKEVNIAHRYRRHLSVLCIELDNYHEVKKEIKEAQAKRLLQEFALKILEVSRETDVLSMLEEGLFGLVIPETDYYGALMLIKRLKLSLREMVFALDLKREIVPVFSIGAASYPKDGEHLIALLRRAREGLRNDRHSLVRTLGLEKRSFWKIVPFLLDLGENPEKNQALADNFLSLSSKQVDVIRNLFLDEACRMGDKRGLIYIGSQKIESNLFDYSGLSRLSNCNISVFNMGARGEKSWSHPEIMPVYLDDKDIRKYRFLLCISENFYYTFIGHHDGENQWKAFHSSDPFIVQEMISKLQERYLLQQRIG